MGDRSFDLERRLHDLATGHHLSPADSVGTRAYFAAPSGGELPVLDRAPKYVFASDNYLGLTADERVQNAERRAATTVGTGAGASRIATGDTLVHHDLERQLAETIDTDRTLSFSSRYAATVGTIAALQPAVAFVDECAHVSVRDGCRLADADVRTYAHRDVDDLERQLETRATAETADESWLIVTDSVFGSHGAVAPLAEIADLNDRYGSWLLVDESHATGLYANGAGIVQAEGLSDRVDVHVGSLSTALASQGGYVAGDESLVEYLVATANPFVHEAGLSPGAAAAASEALHIARHGGCRERLWENVAHLRRGLSSVGFDVPGESHIVAIRVETGPTARNLAAELDDRDVVVTPIEPPGDSDARSYLRVTPMATHEPADIVTCLEALSDAGESVGVL